MNRSAFVRNERFFLDLSRATMQALDEDLASALCKQDPRIAEIMRSKGHALPFLRGDTASAGSK